MNIREKWFSSVKSSVAIVATIILIIGSLITLSTAVLAVTQQSTRSLEVVDMQNLIFVWASGTALIQQKASHICQTDNISANSCAEISADVRSAWLDVMQVDPASLGRIGVPANPIGRAQVYNVLSGKLSALTYGKESLLLTQTQQTLQQLNASALQANKNLMPTGTTSYTVWATSFTQKSLPNGLKPRTSPYVALPDAYLKYANWGNISSIAFIDPPYSAQNGTNTSWSVTISLNDGTSKLSTVPVTDVG